MTDDAPRGERGDDRILRAAKRDFKKAEDWEASWRQLFVADIKFANGDSDNLYQWPSNALNSRGHGSGEEKPCLTINKTRQHCLQIINDARQNKTSVKIKPAGDGATYEAAQVLEGIVRHIEYISDAESAYQHATTMQVQGGIGYVRVTTDYADDTTFDQEIYIRRVQDSLSVYLDPDMTEADGSDGRFGIIFADISREDFEAQYPDVNIPDNGAPKNTLGHDDWIKKDTIRVAEYYYRVQKRDRLIVFTDPSTGVSKPVRESDTKGFSGDLLAAFKEQMDAPDTRIRDIVDHDVKWVKIAGNEIIERRDWPGTTIPIAYAVGEQTVIDGNLDRKGHVRALKDAQRSYNYNASAAIEYGALQGKSPWLAPAAAIEGYQTFWETANTENYSVLPWNHKDDDGNDIPAPERAQPPSFSPLYEKGMETAANDMMLVSGQYQAMMGEPSNEKSGKAIQARQRQGENSTYHFIDHQARMIRRIGKIIMELVPNIYDTPRVIKILGEDGADSDVQLDPASEQAYQEHQAETEDAAAQVIMNPTIGRYDVMSDVGPDFATRRQEAFNALSQIAAQNPELMSVIGDLVMLAADFPMADEAAERLRRMVPAQAMGGGVNPQVAQLQQQLQSTQQLMAAMSAKLVDKQSKETRGAEQKDIDQYRALTERLKVLMAAHPSQKDILQWLHDFAIQEHQGNIGMVSDANSTTLASAAADDQQGSSDA